MALDFWPFRSTRGGPVPRIVLNDDHFFIRDDDTQRQSVRFEDIQSIYAAKLDNFAVDEIVLAFHLPGERVAIVSEDWVGYNELYQLIEAHPLVTNVGWFLEVAFPAFAENRTLVFDRSKQPPDTQSHAAATLEAWVRSAEREFGNNATTCHAADRLVALSERLKAGDPTATSELVAEVAPESQVARLLAANRSSTFLNVIARRIRRLADQSGNASPAAGP